MQNELTLKPGRRQKLKLSFEQLEREMELDGNILSTPMDLSAIAGGSTIDDYIAYFQSLGFTFAQDANGNYYSGSYMWLDPVRVTAHRRSGSGYGSGSYVSAWDYQAALDLWGEPGYGGGGGGGTTPTSPNVNGNTDPFNRDANGNIIADPSDTYFLYEGYYSKFGVKLYMKQVTLHTISGDVIAYEVVNVLDSQGNYVTVDEKYKANCYGAAFADGKYWLNVDNTATQIDESAGF